MKPTAASLSLLSLLSLCPMLSSRLPAQIAPCRDLQDLTSIGQSFAQAFPLTGGLVLAVEQRGNPVYQQAFGGFSLGEVVPIASATKTLSAVVLMALVDDGLLALDDRVGQYLPEWNTGPRANITLRQCFAHTSGLITTHPALSSNTITLRQAAQQLASTPLQNTPGSAFAYGGVSMHVAGAVCEVVSGRSWAQLFQQKVAQPLGMTATDYLAFGPTQNPRIAGGAQSNAADFGALMAMLNAEGVWQGRRVLSVASVREMLRDQTSLLPVVSTPHLQGAPYGIGIWLDRRDAAGQTRLASAGGAFGFIAWVDRDHRSSGVWVVLNRYGQVDPYVQQVWSALDGALLPDQVSCFGEGSPACAAGTWVNASAPPRAGMDDFALLVRRAPAAAFGGIALGLPLAVPQPVQDLSAHVALPALAFAPLVTDAAGSALLPVSLRSVASGLQLGVQAVFLPALPCSSSGLVASHGLLLIVP